ncbi:hypothetical protein INT45_010763 [Circinella minor]|uniref:Globin domain-containing protein n=1 Tax=Circinella minor TaxID=1195481 RepID=A0A8H7VFZ6_9FUNG|nr:hypothetical protein INT45_010763 [Circinella minor]
MTPSYPSPPTKAQTQLIRQTWERVSEKRHEKDNPNVSASYAFGKQFYESLFIMEPELKNILTNSLQQARVLTGVLSYITRAPSVMPARYKEIKNIRDMNAMLKNNNNKNNNNNSDAEEEEEDDDDDMMEELNEEEEAWMVEKLQELGARHVGYKIVKESLFDSIGPALVEALQNRLDNEYKPHMGEAWLKAHYYVVFHMKKGLQSQLVWEGVLENGQQDQYRKYYQQRSRSNSSASLAKANNCSIQ